MFYSIVSFYIYEPCHLIELFKHLITTQLFFHELCEFTNSYAVSSVQVLTLIKQLSVLSTSLSKHNISKNPKSNENTEKKQF